MSIQRGSLTKFQSTLSVRRATFEPSVVAKIFSFQSTLSVRRATVLTDLDQALLYISIHALRKESDWPARHIKPRLFVFQSTLSVRRATVARCGYDPTKAFQSTLSVRRAT